MLCSWFKKFDLLCGSSRHWGSLTCPSVFTHVLNNLTVIDRDKAILFDLTYSASFGFIRAPSSKMRESYSNHSVCLFVCLSVGLSTLCYDTKTPTFLNIHTSYFIHRYRVGTGRHREIFGSKGQRSGDLDLLLTDLNFGHNVLILIDTFFYIWVCFWRPSFTYFWSLAITLLLWGTGR